jgi:hypothetical protein
MFKELPFKRRGGRINEVIRNTIARSRWHAK